MKNITEKISGKLSCAISGLKFSRRAIGLALLLTVGVAPNKGWACACGCGIYDVGCGCPSAQDSGGTVFLEYNYQDQDRNWSGTSSAPAANNDDKEIRTEFITFGLQYMFDTGWGARVELPYVVRYFHKTGDAGNDVRLNWSGIGDLRIKGIYNGFLPDRSFSINFGIKLPTGSYTHNDADGDIDRDTQIGTGSTDLLLGGSYHHPMSRDGRWNWFAQTQLDMPMIIADNYRPGVELNSSVGIRYKGLSLGGVAITPVAQVLVGERTSDTGANSADPVASGFQRVLLSPGVEFKFHLVSVCADVEIPVYQRMTGNQLVVPILFKLVASYRF